MANPKGTGLVERAVREALGTLVSPQLCEQLIARSLSTHGLAAIPEGGGELRQWIEGSLRAEVETAVGPDAADLLVMQLGPIAAYASIATPQKAPRVPEKPARVSSLPAQRDGATDPLGQRRLPQFDDFDDEPDRPTALRFDTSAEPDWGTQKIKTRENPFDSGPPTGMYQNKELSFSPVPEPNTQAVRTLPPARPVSAPPPKETLQTSRPAELADYDDFEKPVPLVLTATADARDLEALRRYLSHSASVVHIPDLVGLLDALEDRTLHEPIVLIDCQRPTVHVTSVAAIGEDLPRGTTVVLWGADDQTWAQIDRDRMPACRWVRCSREATTDDVGSLCSMLLG